MKKLHSRISKVSDNRGKKPTIAVNMHRPSNEPRPKYQYTPKTIEQKRADEWHDIEAMEYRERMELDAEKDAAEYREYMDEQAEKAAEREDKLSFWIALYSFFVFLMGFSWTATDEWRAWLVFLLFVVGAMASYACYALQLRSVSPFTEQGVERKGGH